MNSCLNPMQKRDHPIRTKIEKINIIIESPYKSIRIPLIRGRKMLGRLYIEYRKENVISDCSLEYDFSSWVTIWDFSKAGESNIK